MCGKFGERHFAREDNGFVVSGHFPKFGFVRTFTDDDELRLAELSVIAGHAAMSVSWPLRSTKREMHTTTGSSPIPYRARSRSRHSWENAKASGLMPPGMRT